MKRSATRLTTDRQRGAGGEHEPNWQHMLVRCSVYFGDSVLAYVSEESWDEHVDMWLAGTLVVCVTLCETVHVSELDLKL